jgi:hypothetical protein
MATQTWARTVRRSPAVQSSKAPYARKRSATLARGSGSEGCRCLPSESPSPSRPGGGVPQLLRSARGREVAGRKAALVCHAERLVRTTTEEHIALTEYEG